MKLKPMWVAEKAMREQAPGSFKSWPFATALALSAIFWLLAWYGDTAQSLIAIWERSDTYAHGFLIVPISAWLIWRRRRVLARLEPRSNFLALLALALVGFGWLLGQLAQAGVAQQYCLVLMIPLLVWHILGNEVVRALAFPLFFLLFAVPFGEFLVPPLMELTADFTAFALKLTGIPVYREGQFLTIPSGSWSVVEACSGLRYLIASLTLGLLYAYLTYRSYVRRAIFVAFSVIVPIVANWLRAYMIVMIGHLSGMKYAAGIDHLIYGWVFFGIVMFILFWIGSFWRDDPDPHPPVLRSAALAQRDKPSLGSVMSATIAAAAVVAVWPVAASRLEGPGAYTLPALQAPPAAGGWQPVTGRITDWTPRFFNARREINQVYAEGERRAGLYVAYYRGQREGAQLITTQNVLVHSGDRRWGITGESRRTLVSNHGDISSIETQLRDRSTRLLVWRWYWVDGQYVMNSYWAKLLQAKSKLLGRGDDGAVVVLYTEVDTEPQTAAGKLQSFVNAMLPGISTGLENARRTRPPSS